MDEPQQRKIRVVLNPEAGEKAGVSTNETTADDLRELMARHGLGDELVVTKSEEQAIATAREAVTLGYDLLVGAGGDGTLGTLACELLDTDTALGVLPLGSVMNIARMLGLPRDLDEAAAVLADGPVQEIDVGEANGQLFFEAGSVGMNAAIFREAQRFDAGEYRSILAAIWIAIRYRPPRMMIQLDDQTIQTRALMVTVANGPYTGLGFTVAPDARLDDGKFDVSVFRRFSRLKLLLHLARIAFGRQQYSPKIQTYRSRRVLIESHSPLPCRADAQDLGTTPVTFETLPASLKVVGLTIAAGQ